MYLPATFVQQLRVRTASGSDRIIFHLSFDIFHFLFSGREAARYSQPIEQRMIRSLPLAVLTLVLRSPVFQFVSQENQVNARQRTFRSVCYL